MISYRKMAANILNNFDTNNEKLSLFIDRGFNNSAVPS